MTACRTQTYACLLRVSKLTADGTPDPGASNAYQSGSLIEITWQPIIDTRPALRQRICDGFCLNVPECDTVLGYDVTVNLCSFDYRLGELLTGGTLLLDDLDNIVGLADAGPDRGCSDRIAIEAFSQAVDLDVAADPLVDIFPQLNLFTPGQKTVNQDGQSNYTFTSRSFPNRNFGDGPFNEYDSLIGVTGWPHAQLDATEIPEATCGFVSVPIS